jgi:5-methylcytosine-specific restriction endonuclease McrA
MLILKTHFLKGDPSMKQANTAKPNVVRDFELFEAEIDTGLPLRLALHGLLACCDEKGRFRWQPPRLKLDVLPYDALDFEAVLNALVAHGFMTTCWINHRAYGCISPHFPPEELPKKATWPPPLSLRLRVYARDHITCVYCGTNLLSKRHSICLDLLIPSEAIEERNLATSCKKCRAQQLLRRNGYVSL